jgi:hypothetical protein
MTMNKTVHTVFSVIIDPVFIVIIDLPSLVFFCMNNAMTALSIQMQVASLSDVILIMLLPFCYRQGTNLVYIVDYNIVEFTNSGYFQLSQTIIKINK